MSAEPRCWLCSGEIQATERTRTLGDLNVPVHVGCFDRLFETQGPTSWSSDSSSESSDEPRRENRRPPAA